MKRLFLTITVALTAMLLATETRAEVDENFYIYLCFGQSNMEGQAPIEPADLSPDERFLMMSTLDCGTRKQGEWYRAIPPLARCTTNLCPADYFGRTMVANLDEGKRVGVVVVAIGGIAIDLFDPDGWEANVAQMTQSWQINAVNEYGGNPLGRLIACAKEAQKSGVIKGILLHQGETDAYKAEWLLKVKKIYEYMLSELNLKAEDVPLIAGEVGSDDQKGACSGANGTIDKLPTVIPTAHVVSSVGCTLMDDNVHFDTAGQRKLGRRYGKEALKVLGIDADIDEDEVPEVDTSVPVDITNKFSYCWGGDKESYSFGDDGLLTYNCAQWGALAAWLGSADWTPYDRVVFEFAEPTSVASQIFIQGSEEFTQWVNAGVTEAACSFDGKNVSAVSQIALQAAADGKITIKRIYLVYKTSTGIHTIQTGSDSRSEKTYNINGLPATKTEHGIIIRNGKKYLSI